MEKIKVWTIGPYIGGDSLQEDEIGGLWGRSPISKMEKILLLIWTNGIIDINGNYIVKPHTKIEQSTLLEIITTMKLFKNIHEIKISLCEKFCCIYDGVRVHITPRDSLVRYQINSGIFASVFYRLAKDKLKSKME